MYHHEWVYEAIQMLANTIEIPQKAQIQGFQNVK